MIIRSENFKDINKLSKGTHEKVWFICENCKIGVLQRYRTYLNQKNGKFCRKCRNKYSANKNEVKMKHSENMKKIWNNDDYKDKMSKILSKACKKSWNNDDGTRRSKIYNKTPYNILKEKIEKENYKLLTTKNDYFIFDGNERKIKIMCNKGHIYETYISRWNKKHRCLECQKKDWNEIIENFKKENYIIISNKDEYNGNKTKLKFICPNKHIHKMSWSDWSSGVRCGKCSSHISKNELEIHSYIESIIGKNNYITNDRNLIKPLELDIIIPEKKLAIEYCGLYWHSETNGNKNKKYHLTKLEKCNKIGYNLLTIFEDEWIQKKNIVKSKLEHILGYNKNKKIYARKCFITEIKNTKTISDFCIENHIQGYTGCSIKLAAYYNHEIVAVMTFSKPSLSKGRKDINKNGIYELSRFCTKYRVIGIAGKMLSFFKKNYDWNEIYSFADKRWSFGNLYEKIGFIKEKDSDPNYFYFYLKDNYKNYKRHHRFTFRKQELKKKFGDNFDPNKTEYENCLNNNWDRIWDCGNFKFVIKNPN